MRRGFPPSTLLSAAEEAKTNNSWVSRQAREVRDSPREFAESVGHKMKGATEDLQCKARPGVLRPASEQQAHRRAPA